MLDDARKFWLAAGCCVLLAGFAVYRYESAFSSGPPAYLHMQEHRSPDISKPVWRQFSQVLEMTRAKAEAGGWKDWSVLLIEAPPRGNDVVLWGSDVIRNQGFDPQSEIERDQWQGWGRLLGFYTRDGTALGFRSRLNPPSTNQTVLTVHLIQPIPSGETTLLIERRVIAGWSTKTNAAGEQTIDLGRFRANPNRLDVRSVLLPVHATLVGYTPAEGTTILRGPSVLAAWLSSDIDTNARRTLTFKLP